MRAALQFLIELLLAVVYGLLLASFCQPTAAHSAPSDKELAALEPLGCPGDGWIDVAWCLSRDGDVVEVPSSAVRVCPPAWPSRAARFGRPLDKANIRAPFNFSDRFPILHDIAVGKLAPSIRRYDFDRARWEQ